MTAAASVGRRAHHAQARALIGVPAPLSVAATADVWGPITGGIVTAALPREVAYARMESGIQVEPDDAGAVSDMASGRNEPAPEGADQPLKILVLADRDWTHPQGGGTGANVYENIVRWAHWGHQVTLVAGEYPGCAPVEMVTPNLVVHRMG